MVITFDLRGTNPSSDDPGAIQEEFVAFVNETIKPYRRTNEKVILIGHSMGCHFACAYARNVPSAVEKVLLIAPAGIQEWAYALSPWLALFLIQNRFVGSFFQVERGCVKWREALLHQISQSGVPVRFVVPTNDWTHPCAHNEGLRKALEVERAVHAVEATHNDILKRISLYEQVISDDYARARLDHLTPPEPWKVRLATSLFLPAALLGCVLLG